MFKQFGGPRTSEEAKNAYKYHLERVKNMQKKVPNDPVVLDTERIFRPTSLQGDCNALGHIEDLNRKLVQNINVIYRSKVGKVDNTMPKCLFTSNYWQRKKENENINMKNQQIFQNINNKLAFYLTRETEAEYTMRRRFFLKNTGRDPNRKPLKVTADWSIIPPQLTIKPDPSKRVKCFFDIQAKQERKGDLINMGRIHIDVYRDLAPIASENFIRICRGDNNLSYKGTILHKVFPGKLCLGGDTEMRKGLGGQSAFGFPLPNESPVLEFNGPGVFGTFTPEPGKNTSQFLITFKKMVALKNNYTAFGKVIFGRALEMIEEFGTKSGFPLLKIKIIKCGVLSPESEKNPRHGHVSIPEELCELIEKLKNEEEKERKQREDFEQKQEFFKQHGFLTKLDPTIPYPQFPWKIQTEKINSQDLNHQTDREFAG